MIKEIWAFLTGGRVVYLEDFDGEISTSIAYKTPSGKLVAERMWPWKIKTCLLEEDGKVLNGGFVRYWWYKYSRKES